MKLALTFVSDDQGGYWVADGEDRFVAIGLHELGILAATRGHTLDYSDVTWADDAGVDPAVVEMARGRWHEP